jgi:competence protein ComEC
MKLHAPAWLADGMVRCPAVPIAAAMCAAIPAARWVMPAWPWAWLAIAAVFVAIGVETRSRGWIASIALLFATAFASAAATQIAIFRYPSDHIAQYAGDDPRLCRLRLYLPNEPRLRTVSFGSRLPFPPKQTTLAEVREVMTKDGWTRASGSVLLQVSQPLAQLAAGQTIEAMALLERPGIAMNPGQFDWQRYYREQGVLVSVQIRRADNIIILDRSPAPTLTRTREEVRRLLAAGFGSERSLDHALIAALVLGDYDPELRDVKDQFRKTGTSHHLAISGMHIAVVGGLVFLLLRLIGVGPRGCWIGGLIVVGFYACVAMPSPPVLRAVILFAVAGVAFLTARFSSAIQLLALTIAVMMAIHPLDFFNAGFQLSFGTVLGLMLLSEPLAIRFAGEPNIILPDEIERLPRGAKLIRWIDKAGVRTLATGVLAWLVSMPLVAAHFTQLNLYQVPASIILAPIVTLSLLLGVLKIVGTALFPSAAPMLATMAAGSSGSMRWIVDKLSGWPYGDVPLSAPPGWLIAACWIALALAIVKWRLASVRIASLTLVAVAFAYMLIGPFWFGSSRTLRTGSMRVTLMSVGAGQCCLVETAGGRTVMIDCGSDSLTDLTSNVVAPVLREFGQTQLDSIFVSHANTDHYSGLAEVADAYDAREVVVASEFEASANETASGTQALRTLRELDLPPRVARPGDRIPLGKDSSIEVLWPKAGLEALDANDTSLVLKLTKGDRSILFTGDIQTDGMRGLLADPTKLRADVLVAPHHGSSEDLTPTLVDAIKPDWILASDDRTPSGKQKRFDAMMAGRRVLRTHVYGAITILIGADGSMDIKGFAKQVE